LTSFLTIYNQNEIFKNDNRLKYKSTNQIYMLYSEYLDFAIGEFESYCYKNLNDNVPFSQNEYLYKANGVDNVFPVATVPVDCIFYVGTTLDINISYVEITNNQYSYDLNNQTITILGNILLLNTIVYISGYSIGYFNVDLSKKEINILNSLMIIPFQAEQQNKYSLLNQLTYGGQGKLSGTQSNHMDSIHKIYSYQIEKMESVMISYTFTDSPDKLKRLGSKT